MPYLILTVALVALDQLVKILVLNNIAPGAHVPFIPHILELTYVQNTGAAFSLFEEHTWILALISLVMSLVLAFALWKNFFRHPLGKVTLTLLLAGAVGNLIDRVRLGYVVDMFHFEFFPSFPVFNVADICVVCGTIGFAAYYLLLHEKVTGRKEAERGGDGHPDGTP